jgi:hypothetical protein
MLAPLGANVDVRNLSGDVRITDDTHAARRVCGDSRIMSTYHVSGDVDRPEEDKLAFADIRALYPDLPARGGRRILTLYAIPRRLIRGQNGRLTVDDSRVAGTSAWR